ncbi:MAG: adenosylcobinamide amidohydrolase [Deltaproteobacteria bacterium]|nr:adenosylcobinamide amidohydrolase [Deltaproteobacteria bacterium]
MVVEKRGRFLVVRFGEEMRILSWAVVGGGFRKSRSLAWLQVKEGELGPDVDPARLLRRRLKEARLSCGVGMMTGTDLKGYQDVRRSDGSLTVGCIATVGLSNALAVGDPPGTGGVVGTVNLLCHVSVPLSRGAMVEVVSLAAEARTAAFMDSLLKSRVSGRPATGTGTDCIAVASPWRRRGERYAGKHTPIGSLIGQAVRQAVTSGIRSRLGEDKSPGGRDSRGRAARFGGWKR